MKTCSKCKEEKELSEFYKKISSKDGHRGVCKECYKNYSTKEIRNKSYNNRKNNESFIEYRKKYREKNIDNIREKNKKYCVDNSEELKSKKKTYYEKNKEKILNDMKEKYQINKELLSNEDILTKRKVGKNRVKKYRERNKELLSERIKNKKRNDPLYRLTDSIRTLIWISIKKMGYEKSSTTSIILECQYDDFKSHIENQFDEKMSWNNYGEWHLDHKTPISWANTEEEVYELNHYTNFQPLWATDNVSKGNKWAD